MTQIVSSISSLPIYAPSAAYAPTNGADVSAIASAYQVVSATAGDGTYITSINGMGISGQGGGGGGVVTATGSASATAGTPWMPTTSYLVSSINGSALLPYGFSSVSANSANWNYARTAVTVNSANWNSVYNTVYSNSASWSGSTGGGSVVSPSGTILVNGSSIEGTNSAVLTAGGEGFETMIYPQDTHIGPQMTRLAGGSVPGTGANLMMPLMQTAYMDIRVILSGRDGDNLYTSASGIIPSGDLTASIPLDAIVGDISASAENWVNLTNAPLTAKKDGGILVTGVGELAWKSAVDNVTNTVSANSASWGGSEAFPVEYNSGNCSASLETGYFVSTSRPSLTLSSTGIAVYPRFIVRNGTGTASKGSYYLSDAFEFTTGSTGGSGTKVLRVDPQQVSSKNFLLYGPSGSTTYGILALRGSDSSAYVCIGSANVEHTNYIRPSSISSWWDVYDHVNSASASWGGGVDSATCSAIASSYAESAMSSKQDSSGMSTYVEKTAYDDLYSAFTAVSSMLNTYSSYFSSISAKVDSTAIGVEE